MKRSVPAHQCPAKGCRKKAIYSDWPFCFTHGSTWILSKEEAEMQRKICAFENEARKEFIAKFLGRISGEEKKS